MVTKFWIRHAPRSLILAPPLTLAEEPEILPQYSRPECSPEWSLTSSFFVFVFTTWNRYTHQYTICRWLQGRATIHLTLMLTLNSSIPLKFNYSVLHINLLSHVSTKCHKVTNLDYYLHFRCFGFFFFEIYDWYVVFLHSIDRPGDVAGSNDIKWKTNTCTPIVLYA